MLRNKEKEQRSLDNNVSSVESEQDLTPPCRNSKLISMYHIPVQGSRKFLQTNQAFCNAQFNV